MKITPGKLKSLENVSDEKGAIRAAAMDQRGSLQKSIAKARGVKADQVSAKDMQDFKIEVTKALTQHSTAILLDPEFGLPASKARAPKSGLLLAYEVTGYDNAVEGRMPELLPGYSVKRLKQEGADCVKLLLYYTPYEKSEINAQKQEFIRKVGAECKREDIAFFLEPVGYDPKGGDPKSLAYAKLKPEIVTKTTAIFTKDEYEVDVLKVEIPVNLKYTQGAESYNGKDTAYTLAEAKDHYRRAAQASTKPFIYLSAGVSESEFRENLNVAIDAGVDFSGVLCGRATWQNGIGVFAKGGASALADWLQGEGLRNIKALNKVLARGVKPWFAKYGGRAKVEVVAN